MKQNKVIAITGGIGTGKSTVLSEIKKLGYPVYSCDETYGELIKDKAFLTELKAIFPVAVDENFCFDKLKLANAVFNDKTKLKKLNDFTHPYILKTIFDKIKNGGDTLSFVEVPLLFEGGYQTLFDGVIVIKRDLEERILSTIKRSGLTREEVLKRIENQFDYEKLNDFAHTIIYNDDLSLLEEKVIDAIKKIC